MIHTGIYDIKVASDVEAPDAHITPLDWSEAMQQHTVNGAARTVKFTPEFISRFLSKADRSPGHGPKGDCWQWTRAKNEKGYGKTSDGQKTILSHRLSYQIHKGHLPSDLMVCHSCDNPSCINPDHLFLGTNADNQRDCYQKGRRPVINPKGEHSSKAKLTNADAMEIRRLYAMGGISQPQLSRKFGVTQSTIWSVIHRNTFSHV